LKELEWLIEDPLNDWRLGFWEEGWSLQFGERKEVEWFFILFLSFFCCARERKRWNFFWKRMKIWVRCFGGMWIFHENLCAFFLLLYSNARMEFQLLYLIYTNTIFLQSLKMFVAIWLISSSDLWFCYISVGSILLHSLE
jgi:hypothetical protein